MHSLQLEIEKIYDVIFVIEGTAINGAYINDLKINYLIPALEFFSQTVFEEREYFTAEKTAILYGIVLYKTAQSMPNNSTMTYGPFSTPQQVISTIDKIDMLGGGSESNANLAEGLATALCCFEDLKNLRHPNEINVQKHCILICNSTPYSMPVLECLLYEGKTVDQLASIFNEKKINFSIISPRKIPILFKLFVKADGDLPLTTKNFCKDPRHLVLLKGFNLKERPASPNSNLNQIQQQHQTQIQQVPTLSTNVTKTMNTQNQITISNTMDTQNPMANLQQQNQIMQNQIHPSLLPQQSIQQNANFNTNQTPANRWLFPNQPRNSFNSGPLGTSQGTSGVTNIGTNLQQPQINGNLGSNSVLITQLNQPSNVPVMNANQQMQTPMLTTAQQQMRIQLINQQAAATPASQQQINPLQQASNISHSHLHQPPLHQNSQCAVTQSNSSNSMNNGGGTSTGTVNVAGDREKIWSGTLEWVEKSKTDQTKSTRCVQSQVIANVRDGEVEVKADKWPQRLLMQLMPKHLVGTIGGEYLKDSRVVVFKPQQSESLEALCKLMHSGFAGCVHFTAPSCDIRILILLYTPEKKTFLGFIPNEQTMFVDQLRKAIQQKQQPGMSPQQQHQLHQQHHHHIQHQQHQQLQQQLQNQPQQIQQQRQETSHSQHQHQQSQQTSQIVSPNVIGGNVGIVSNQQNAGLSQESSQQHFNVYSQNQMQMQMQQDQMQNNMQQINIMQQRVGIGGLMQQGPNGANITGLQNTSNQLSAGQQPRGVRPMMSNPGLRMLLQQPGAQPGNQFRPQLQQIVGSNPNMMGGQGSMQRSNTFDDSNFDFM